MSVHGIQPQFKDYEGYQAWRSDWRELYAHAGSEVRQSKLRIKALQRASDPQAGSLQAEHRHKRAIARKLMTALETAKIRWNKIKAMRQSIKDQPFPLEVETRNIDFHFNKVSIEFPFMPAWVVKAQGKSYYVSHMDCQTGFSTRETPDNPSTKGSLRVKRGTLLIDAMGAAVIR